MSLFSAHYLVFLAAAVLLTQAFPSHRRTLVLVASLIFYATWHPSFPIFLVLLTAGTVALLQRPNRARVAAAIAVNVVLLLSLKFVPWRLFGSGPASPEASGFTFYQVVVPIGISFYSLQLIGLALDVSWNRAPRPSLRAALEFVSFFPKLLSGPLERWQDFFSTEKNHPARLRWERIEDGLRLILAGFFKKAVLAGCLALYVDAVYADFRHQSAFALLAAAVAFRYQLYGDFSGYVDIARGSARLLGYELSENFRAPYLSTSLREHWRRWHITLGAWFRDYVYFPITYRAPHPAWIPVTLLAVFFLIGLWHGWQPKFLLWGLLNGALLLLELAVVTFALRRGWVPTGRMARALLSAGGWAFTFGSVALTAVLIRAPNLEAGTQILGTLGFSGWSAWPASLFSTRQHITIGVGIFTAVALELLHLLAGRRSARKLLENFSGPLRLTAYVGILALIALFGSFSEDRFIYFQF